MQYTSAEALLMDDGFLAWYHHTDEQEVLRWNEWIAFSEQNRRLAEEAVGFMMNLDKIEAEAVSLMPVEEGLEQLERTITAMEGRNKKRQAQPVLQPVKANQVILLRSWVKVGVRNLVRNKVYSFINVTGLSVGMAVAMLIGLWILDEFSFNKYHQHYDRIVQVWQHEAVNGEKYTGPGMPVPIAAELRKRFPEDFQYVTAVNDMQFLMRAGNNTFIQRGFFMGADAPEMLSLQMLHGSRSGLKDPSSIMLSASVAHKLFANADPIGQRIRLNDTYTVQVSGVYADLPHNSQLSDASFISPWQFFMANWDWIRGSRDNWGANCTQVIAQLAPQADIDRVSEKIKGLLAEHIPHTQSKLSLFLYPMSRWHLYSNFNNGVESGGAIVYVRLFGMIGAFVLLLACINFMNLSTARSEKRAKEVGIRKTMGSARSQLIGQFFSESILLSLIAFMISLLIMQAILPWFNRVADKDLSIPAIAPLFWLAGIAFSLFTGLVAGSYPAIYLSSFQPIKVLKGTFRAGRLASMPRKVLVVVQFSVSVLLIIGTIVVFKQIQFARDRPVGYDRTGLISIQERTQEIYQNYHAIRNELLRRGVAEEMSESQCPVTDIWANSGGVEWEGKSPGLQAGFAVIGVRHEFGKTVGLQFIAGRDFSAQLPTDSSGLLLNEAAVRYMGMKDPVGKTIRWNGYAYKVLGVTKDMVMASPYQPVPQTMFYILREGGNFINIRLSQRLGVAESLKGVEAVFKELDPAAPFDYHFANEEYARKFASEERIGKLAAFFAVLAIFISCLGLFGLASFVAEQRTREIGVRKVLGATIYNLWELLSKDFVVLVGISLLIAMPLAWFCMHSWLQQYTYRASISWWIFAATGAAALLITIATVSVQAVRAAMANPVKSLRTE